MPNLTKQLLDWYAEHGRDMPWRVKGGAHSDPYAVWISEIMLQQTTVVTVVDYFKRWMKRFPTIQSVADADIQDVLLMWQGLGYYTRAKKIHECARMLMEKYDGVIPSNRDELLKLPGIGPYTASSVCAFAFNQSETVVDGNVIRVIARLHGLTHAVTKDEIYTLAQQLTSKKNGADYASAIMDLGAMVCTPSSPKCPMCPWVKSCVAYKKDLAAQIPLIQKPEKKKRTGSVYLIEDTKGRFLIQKRAGKGLLSGLYEFPWNYENAQPFDAKWELVGGVSHTFTHFHLALKVYRIQMDRVPKIDGIWVIPSDFKDYPFSTLMKKIIRFI